jgi:hypothetical protein
MATKPKLLEEALDALRAIQRLNFSTSLKDDGPMYRAMKRVNTVLNKAVKLKAA